MKFTKEIQEMKDVPRTTLIDSLSTLAANVEPHDNESAVVAALEACGIGSFRLQGRLATVEASARIADGKPIRSLIVSVETCHGTQALDLDLGSPVAQRHTRKLADAIPGEETEIVCWDNPHDCSRKGDGCWPPFSWQYATVEQSGKPLPSADASELYSRIKAAQVQMINAGNTSGWMLVAMQDCGSMRAPEYHPTASRRSASATRWVLGELPAGGHAFDVTWAAADLDHPAPIVS